MTFVISKKKNLKKEQKDLELEEVSAGALGKYPLVGDVPHVTHLMGYAGPICTPPLVIKNTVTKNVLNKTPDPELLEEPSS